MLIWEYLMFDTVLLHIGEKKNKRNLKMVTYLRNTSLNSKPYVIKSSVSQSNKI